MLIGINCFKDIEIKSMIQSGNKKGICDITKEKDIYIYDTSVDNYLDDYFTDIIDVYTPKSDLPEDFPCESLALLSSTLYSDWNIFCVSEDEIDSIIKNICNNYYDDNDKVFTEPVGIKALCDYSFMNRNCLMKTFSWAQFKSSIKTINRFHSNHINLELLKNLFESDAMNSTYKTGELCLYRGRISDQHGFSLKEMGPPPSKLATSGRANSAGINCLYLANDIDTIFHEIRARDFDYGTIGKFELKNEIHIIDLSKLETISPFANDEFEKVWFAINMKILQQMNNEIAKPLRRQDSELDYLPTQYIADFIKSLGYDGICYKSTLSSGLNYAIFNSTKFKCVNTEVYLVESVQPKYNKIM